MESKGPKASRPGALAVTRRRIADRVDKYFKYWALLPAAFLLLVLTVQPAVNLLRLSLSTIDVVDGGETWKFTPARNWDLLLNDTIFPSVLRNTLIFVVVAVAIEMVLGFALAVLVTRLRVGKGTMRTLMILPILLPGVTIGSMWKLMYNFDFGVFNQIFNVVGLPNQNWLGSHTLALGSVIAVDVWHWTPFVFLIMFAGLESLPLDVMEAARADGARGHQMLRYVILPMAWPTISVALLFRTIVAFKVFDEIFLLTSGGPGLATEVTSLYVWKVMFQQNRLGYGSLLAIVVIVVSVFVVLLLRRMGSTRLESRGA